MTSVFVVKSLAAPRSTFSGKRAVSFALASILLLVAACAGTTSTESPTTTADAATTTAFAPATTTLPPVPREFSANDLVKATPGVMDLPAGWTAFGGVSAMTGSQLEESAAADPSSWGVCGGTTRDQIAVSAGAISTAALSLNSPTQQSGTIWIYAFDNSSQARQFLGDSADATTCGSREYLVVEVDYDDPTTVNASPVEGDLLPFDGFGGEDGVGEEWTISESVSAGSADIDGADQVLTVTFDQEALITSDGLPYGFRTLEHRIYERYEHVVVIWDLRGTCCSYGFSNTDAIADDHRPTFAQLIDMANAMRDGLLERLGSLVESA